MRTRGHTARMAVAGVLAALLGGSLAGCQDGSAEGDSGSPSASSTSASPSERGASGMASGSPGWDTDPDSLAAVGDSITRAFDACGPLADCPESSWATGTDPAVDSLASRLLDRPSRDSRNLAVSGATMADLPRQMAQAADREPGLVTVLIGANDACRPSVEAMTPVAGFRADFEEALRTLRDESPESQVYVASIPDLERLWQVGRGEPDARQVWEFGICPSMLRAPQATGDAATARREQVSARVDAYNSVLRQVCAEDRLCRWDGGAVHDYRFTAEALSGWDWFHPSREGQSELAELAYERVTES
jgi:lysophospholipase L1-like esterase